MNPREFFAKGGPGEMLGRLLWDHSREQLVALLESDKRQHVLTGGYGAGKTFVMLCGLAYDVWEFLEQEERAAGPWLCLLKSEQREGVVDYMERILRQVRGWQVVRQKHGGAPAVAVAKEGAISPGVLFVLAEKAGSLIGNNLLSVVNDCSCISFWEETHRRWMSRGPTGRWWMALNSEESTISTLTRPRF